MKQISKIYRNRFKNLNQDTRNNVWKILCKYFFQKHIDLNSKIVDVSCGNCEFINNINASDKYAFDINVDSKEFVDKDVEFINKSLFEINRYVSNADYIFCSNTLEHLNTKEDLLKAFEAFHQTLKGGGKLLILQPNIRYVKYKYWDFVDHKIPLTDKSIIEAGEITGFRVIYNLKKFLPYTMKSSKPKFGWLIRLYLLLLPISGFFMGEQSFLILEKIDE